RRHQVLDGLDLGAFAGQPGAQRHFGDEVGAGRYHHHRVQIDATEHDAVVERCRVQGHVDLVTTVQADAGGADRILESALQDHGVEIGRQPLTAASSKQE